MRLRFQRSNHVGHAAERVTNRARREITIRSGHAADGFKVAKKLRHHRRRCTCTL